MTLGGYVDQHPRLCQSIEAEVPIGKIGAWYIGHLLDGLERVASVHVAIWDTRGQRDYSAIRASGREFMDAHEIDRLVAEVPIENTKAQRFAERVGLRRVGLMKQRPMADGSRSDVVMFEAIKGEL
jgi:RimJ/RimL family protein N-acetyltransferase